MPDLGASRLGVACPAWKNMMLLLYYSNSTIRSGSDISILPVYLTYFVCGGGGGCDIKVRLTPLFSSPSHCITLGYVVRRDTSILQRIRTAYLASKPAATGEVLLIDQL